MTRNEVGDSEAARARPAGRPRFAGARRAAAAVALLGVASTLPGCVLAIGNSRKGDGERIHALERRMKKAEDRLGIQTPPKPEQQS